MWLDAQAFWASVTKALGLSDEQAAEIRRLAQTLQERLSCIHAEREGVVRRLQSRLPAAVGQTQPLAARLDAEAAVHALQRCAP